MVKSEDGGVKETSDGRSLLRVNVETARNQVEDEAELVLAFKHR